MKPTALYPVTDPPVDNNPAMLRQGATATFQLFMAYVEAGFTRDEALQLVIGVLRPAPPPPSS